MSGFEYCCLECRIVFTGLRSMVCANSVKCPKCKSGRNVVRTTHPFVRLSMVLT